MYRLRHGDVRDTLSFGEHPGELLRVQRVSAGSLEKQGLCFGRENAPLEQELEQAARILVRER